MLLFFVFFVFFWGKRVGGILEVIKSILISINWKFSNSGTYSIFLLSINVVMADCSIFVEGKHLVTEGTFTLISCISRDFGFFLFLLLWRIWSVLLWFDIKDYVVVWIEVIQSNHRILCEGFVSVSD